MKGLRIVSLIMVFLTGVFELVIGILSFTMKHQPITGSVFLLISILLFYLTYQIIKEIKNDSRRKD